MMDTVYFELVINSMRTCDENNKTLPMVPNRHLAAVLAMLEKDGRDANGKKVFGEWSNAYPFSVSAITPSQPVITSVKVSGSTVTVTYTKASNADGYDVVLGTSTKKVNGETRPVEYGKLVKKNIKGNVVTATFKNVKKGTYYAGLHAFNRTSEDGKKVFSQWSNVKKVNVK